MPRFSYLYVQFDLNLCVDYSVHLMANELNH